MAIIVTAGAEDACCIMGQLHIETGEERQREREKEADKRGAGRDDRLYYSSSHQVLL